MSLIIKKKHSMSERPRCFTLDYTHPLARQLIHAGLGNDAGSLIYKDSSKFANHGIKTANIQATTLLTPNWHFDMTLKRFIITMNIDNPNAANWGFYIKMPYNFAQNLNIEDNFTIMAWRKYHSEVLPGIIFGCSDGIYGGGPYTNGFQLDGTSSSCKFMDGGSTQDSVYQCTTPPPDTWFHLTALINNGKVTMYLNGKVDNDSLFPHTKTSFIGPNNIGATYDAETMSMYLGGQLIDTMLYKRALSPREIAQLADPRNTMLSGLIKSVRKPIFAFNHLDGIISPGPGGSTSNRYQIFRSRIIRGAK